MNAHEFRIGNYVAVEGAIARITAIDGDGNEATVEVMASKDNRKKTSISEIKPVLLNPQLLNEIASLISSGGIK